MKIGVFGLGYVGLSQALLLGQHNTVYAMDIDETRIQLLQQQQSPIHDKDIEQFISEGKSHVIYTTDRDEVIKHCSLFIISTPTDYNVETKSFNTKSIETLLEVILDKKPDAVCVVKSTVPIGFTQTMRQRFSTSRIIFSPEFLREGHALHDNLHPQRIIIGDTTEVGHQIAFLFSEGSMEENVPTLFMGSQEAEAVKLFSNTYLAMRVAYFNELDNYALTHGLDAKAIIQGMGYDNRIGLHYNNPSFGYGGYCLPKDSKQLCQEFGNIPSPLISAIVSSNDARIQYISDDIMKKQPKVVGVYQLAMKKGSDNNRYSSIIEVMRSLKQQGVQIIIYDSMITTHQFLDYEVKTSFSDFVETSDIILTNRMEETLLPYQSKVYTRDVFHRD